MTYQLKYIAGSGGEFVWHTLICSPECTASFPPHTYRTSVDYIVNEVYKPTRQPRDWTVRLELLAKTELRRWIDTDSHDWHDPLSNRFYSPTVKDRPADIWLYQTDLHRIKAWRTLFQSHESNQFDLTGWADLPAVHNQMHKRKYQLGKRGRYHSVDWIWDQFDAEAYESLCVDCGLTPVVESAELLHKEYALCRARLAKYWLSWYKNEYQPDIEAVANDIRLHLLDQK